MMSLLFTWPEGERVWRTQLWLQTDQMLNFRLDLGSSETRRHPETAPLHPEPQILWNLEFVHKFIAKILFHWDKQVKPNKPYLFLTDPARNPEGCGR